MAETGGAERGRGAGAGVVLGGTRCLRPGEERSRQHSAQACLLGGGVPVLGCRSLCRNLSSHEDPLLGLT